ncbi:MAG: hypothetical protein U5L02_05290 [Rheinheimera sp.]|nr:hypothetical protein [Rheinheimera sp.]
MGSNTGALTIGNIGGGSGPYEYSLDDRFFYPVGELPARIPDLASGGYTLHIRDANDCPATLAVAVPEGQELVLLLGRDSTIQAGDSLLLAFPNGTSRPSVGHGHLTSGQSQPDSPSTYAAPLPAPPLTRLQATDENGCTTFDLVRITVERNVNVYIPSAFSLRRERRPTMC